MKEYSEEMAALHHDSPSEHDGLPAPVRRTRFAEQIPVIVLTAALVIGALAWMRHTDSTQRAADLEPLRAQNEALQAQSEENRRQLESTTQLLKQAITKSDGMLFRPEQEIQKLNDQRVTLLADEIAKKIQPALPAPKSAEEMAQLQQEQTDKVANRLTDNLRPMIADLSTAQKNASAETAQRYETRVQELNKNLRQTQAAAQDALALTHEVSALYLDSFKDQGVLMRLFSLPANLVIDTAKLNLVTSRDRAKAQQELSAKMSELEKRLSDIHTVAVTDTKG